MKTLFSRKSLCSVALLVSMFPTLSRAAQDVKEQHTGLPLHPELTFQQKVNSPICGKKTEINLYDAPYTATLAEYVTWYKEHMKGAHYVHKIWSNRAQELFYSADGLTGVGITGSRTGPGVFSVSYLKISSPLTTYQMDQFSPQNSVCK